MSIQKCVRIEGCGRDDCYYPVNVDLSEPDLLGKSTFDDGDPICPIMRSKLGMSKNITLGENDEIVFFELKLFCNKKKCPFYRVDLN